MKLFNNFKTTLLAGVNKIKSALESMLSIPGKIVEGIGLCYEWMKAKTTPRGESLVIIRPKTYCLPIRIVAGALYFVVKTTRRAFNFKGHAHWINRKLAEHHPVMDMYVVPVSLMVINIALRILLHYFVNLV